MNKTKNVWTMMAVVASVCFLLMAGTVSSAAAADDCKAFEKKFTKTAGQYQDALKTANKLASKKKPNIGKLNAAAKDAKKSKRAFLLTMERNEGNKEKCAKEWSKAEKSVKTIEKLSEKNRKLLAKIKSKQS
ncbi:MAG: hypothetical protein JEZ11_19920 [Desulfobacterales bacterium]|nr:hypothetical protein [Desulfobacterales bacterium]